MQVRPALAGDSVPIERLIAATSRRFGQSLLSERKTMELARGEGVGYVVENEGIIVGYAHGSDYGDRAAVEVVTLDASRVVPLVSGVADALDRELAVWAWEPAQVEALRAAGYEQARALYQLRRQLPPNRKPEPIPGIRIESFQPGRDEEEWLALNNVTFAEHPEQSEWDHTDLAQRMAQDWFDPADFHVAREGGAMVGFCWTKVHPPGTIGEIYIIGVHPAARGRSLATALTLVGLWHLYEADGVEVGMLYVDGANEVGMRMYQRLGFEPYLINRLFR